MSFYKLPDTLSADIAQYEEIVSKYLKGEISRKEMRSHRVPMGIYEQRVDERYMMRIRAPGGDITPTQLIKVAEIAKRYTTWNLHFTTRQDVQLHYIELPHTIEIMRLLMEIGLATRGGGGNTVRNITAGWDSGINKNDVFNVVPYARALTNRLIAEPDSWLLPRKFKINFSGNPGDSGLATIADLGFIAKKNEKGERGFSVYVAGGLGRHSKTGALLYGFVDHNETYNVVRACKNLFNKHGNRKNKHANRLRFLFEKVGREDFFRLFEKELALVREEKYPPLETTEVRERFPGYFEIPFFLGDISADKAIKLGGIMERYGEDTIRINVNQNLIIHNVPESEASSLKKILTQDGILEEMHPLISGAVACAGASTCRLGICLSRNLLTEIRKEIENTLPSLKNLNDVSLKVSGCSNSCGQHIIADIGFFGNAKRLDNRPVPAYKLVCSGVVKEGKTRLAENCGVIPARNIPSFMKDLLVHLSETRNAGEPFHEYYERTGKSAVSELIKKHSAVPGWDDDKRYYYDWGAEKPFSLAERLEGECAAGLFDMIEIDMNIVKDTLESFDASAQDAHGTGGQEAKQNALRRAVLHTSRALLITKGEEAKTDGKVIDLFRKHFIGKHVDSKFSAMLDSYAGSTELEYDGVKELFDAVSRLYNSMDDSLRFPEIKAVEVTANRQFRDFRGVPCPLNFVKTKLVLDVMKKGDVLEILLDDGEPIDNVPGSVKAEGHKVLSQTQNENYWSVEIEKGT